MAKYSDFTEQMNEEQAKSFPASGLIFIMLPSQYTVLGLSPHSFWV